MVQPRHITVSGFSYGAIALSYFILPKSYTKFLQHYYICKIKSYIISYRRFTNVLQCQKCLISVAQMTYCQRLPIALPNRVKPSRA